MQHSNVNSGFTIVIFFCQNISKLAQEILLLIIVSIIQKAYEYLNVVDYHLLIVKLEIKGTYGLRDHFRRHALLAYICNLFHDIFLSDEL